MNENDWEQWEREAHRAGGKYDAQGLPDVGNVLKVLVAVVFLGLILTGLGVMTAAAWTLGAGW